MDETNPFDELINLYAPLPWNKRLKALREKTGMTAEQFAKSIGISFYTYRHYEQGTREPSLARLRLLADALGVVTDDILPSTDLDSEDVLDIPTRRLLMLLDISTGKLRIDDVMATHADKSGLDILGVETAFGIAFDKCSDIIRRNEDTRAAAVKAHIGRLIAKKKASARWDEDDTLGIAAAEAMGFDIDELNVMRTRIRHSIDTEYKPQQKHDEFDDEVYLLWDTAIQIFLLHIVARPIRMLMFTYFVGHTPWFHDPWKKTRSVGFLERRLLRFFYLDEQLCRKHFGNEYDVFLSKLYDRYLMSLIICFPRPLLKAEWDGLFTSDGISELNRYKHRFSFPTEIGKRDTPLWEENGTIDDTGMSQTDEVLVLLAQREAGHLERLF